MNLSAGYRADDWEVSLYGRNIFDEFYLNSRNPGIGPGQINVIACTPVEYGIVLARNF